MYDGSLVIVFHVVGLQHPCWKTSRRIPIASYIIFYTTSIIAAHTMPNFLENKLVISYGSGFTKILLMVYWVYDKVTVCFSNDLLSSEGQLPISRRQLRVALSIGHDFSHIFLSNNLDFSYEYCRTAVPVHLGDWMSLTETLSTQSTKLWRYKIYLYQPLLN